MKKIINLIGILFFSVYCMAQSYPENVELTDLAGKKVSLKNIVKGELVIISFWSTTCKPCLSELEALQDLQDEWKGKLRIIAVSIDDSRSVAKVKSLVNGKKWPFEVFLDVNKELYQAFNLTAIPSVRIIDHQGKIRYSHTGYTPGDENVLIEKALQYSK